jgi:hypothetical protein
MLRFGYLIQLAALMVGHCLLKRFRSVMALGIERVIFVAVSQYFNTQ